MVVDTDTFNQPLFKTLRPGLPVAKTLHSQCRGPRSDPWSGNYTPHATAKGLHATLRPGAAKQMFF